MIRAIIIDDEENNISNLQALLARYCPEVNVVATARNAEEGEASIRREDPGLIFLDIQMPGRDGFDLLRSLDHYSFAIIFITAHAQYGIQAVKFSAIDYLLKPVDVEELKLAVGKAVEKLDRERKNWQLENLIQVLTHGQKKAEHRIALQSARETRFVQTGQIIRCESSNNYTSFYLQGGEKLLTSRPIFEYEEMLEGYGFFRCHQSHLVNKKYIRSWIKEDGGYLLMEDGSQVPVSRSKKEELRQLFG